RRKNTSPKYSSNGVQPWGPAPRDTVLMLITAGLMASAIDAKVPPWGGIWTGTTGIGLTGAGAASWGRRSSARDAENAPKATPATRASASAATKFRRLSCIIA